MDTSINSFLTSEIAKLDSNLMVPGCKKDLREMRAIQATIAKVIDELGELSATSQGLNKVITSAEKMRNTPGHVIYLLKDAAANNGRGAVIGFLKVGRKHLFLFDERNQVCEVEPLCVLDFYVLQDRQRSGYGRKLFDYMMKDMDVEVKDMAIDGPSPKMEQFLCKVYGTKPLVRQNNNFATTADFFTRATDVSCSGRSTPVTTPMIGRYAASQPTSAIAGIIHGDPRLSKKVENRSLNAYAEMDAEVAAVRPVEIAMEVVEERPSPEEASPEAVPPNGPNGPKLVSPYTQARADAPEIQWNNERPTSLQVQPTNAPVTPRRIFPPGHNNQRRDSQLTDAGYFDVKFYHNKLW